jgi:20S proteasome subunit beta 6
LAPILFTDRDPDAFNWLLVGSGAVYSFDPVGSYERESCRAAGAASSLMQPFLDNQASVPHFIHQKSVLHIDRCI